MGHGGGEGRGSLPEKIMFKKRCLSEGVMWVLGRKVFQGGRNNLCKGPEAELHLPARWPMWLEQNEQGEGGDGGRKGKGQTVWAWWAMGRTLGST